MEKVKVLGKGQLVIPAALRKKYGIRPGSELQILEHDRVIVLLPPAKDPVGDALGCLPDRPSLSRELLEERQRDPIS